MSVAGQAEAGLVEQPLLQDVARSLHADFLPAWYPRAIDRRRGGFITGMAADWQPEGDQRKYLVGQSRHLWTVSRTAIQFDMPEYREYAEHGFRFLRRHLWDRRRGGFFYAVSPRGQHLLPYHKDAYSNAFAIFALSACYRATGDSNALQLAYDTAEWVECRSRRSGTGAWHNHLAGYRPAPGFRALLRRRKSLPDSNTLLHLLEAFVALHRVAPQARLAQLIGEIVDQLVHEFLDPRSFIHARRNPDFSTTGDCQPVSFGHDIEAAYLLLAAAMCVLPQRREELLTAAMALVDMCLGKGFDVENGGLYFQGQGQGTDVDITVTDRRKVWWVQAEALNSLLILARLVPTPQHYRDAACRQWSYIKRWLIDPRQGGWYDTGLDSDPTAAARAKARQWKVNYHDGRAYLNAVALLAGNGGLPDIIWS